MKAFHDSYRFGVFDIDGIKFPRVLLGSSPFIGAGQFGDRAYRYYESFYEKPENITQTVIECIMNGCNAVHVIAYPVVVRAIGKAMKETGIECFVFGTVGIRDVRRETEDLLGIGAKCIVTHAAMTDWNLARASRVLDIIQSMDSSLITGIATHNLLAISRSVLEYDNIRVILLPLNKIGEFINANIEDALEAVRVLRVNNVRVIAMKPLAAGLLNPFEAFKFLSGHVDGVTVGMTNTREIKETLLAARKFFSESL
ncbi:MAG: hypothetical protein QXY40_07800 [Candidatus Methanomethylicia archaeon]